jgi:hypothetical protein
MAFPVTHLAPWARKHDLPGSPLIAQAPTIAFPQSLEDLIAICKGGSAKERLHAAGSHWALSEAAVSDQTFIETHDYNNILPAMGRTLSEVVPGCLSASFLDSLNASTAGSGVTDAPFYFVHIESGKRIYQAYAELDQVDDGSGPTLSAQMEQEFANTAFRGPWGFATLGGAGGQTVVGALSTGTHGGDFDRGPLSDAVVALHLVTDGGKHHWIERGKDRDSPGAMTDEAALKALYGAAQYGGPENFEVHYSSELLDAVRVQVGRFGIIYSVVLEVAKQYGLRSQLRYSSWENVKAQIPTRDPQLFAAAPDNISGAPEAQRFLQLALCPVPTADGSEHICAITRHWQLPLAALATPPQGRAERVGKIETAFDPTLNAPRFENAGDSQAYSQNGPSTFAMVCANPSFIAGVVELVYAEVEKLIEGLSIEEGGALAAVIVVGGALAPEVLLALVAILALLVVFLELLKETGPQRAGQAIDELRKSLLSGATPAERAAGIIVWRAIALEIFKSMQKEEEFDAISYAVMDGWNYTDRSCNVNVISTEVFFDAGDPNLIAFVDRLLMFESDQEWLAGDAVAGYVSLRFTGRTGALIGPEAFAATCSIECSGLADVDGSNQFVEFAEALARDPNIKGILHWGQRNESNQQEIELRFGDTPANPTGPLHQWRAALAAFTENGRLGRFTSAFTRKTGLEIVQPAIVLFTVSEPDPGPAPSHTLSWDCAANPAGTAVQLEIVAPSGTHSNVGALALTGTHALDTTEPGQYEVTLLAFLQLGGESRAATSTVKVTRT